MIDLNEIKEKYPNIIINNAVFTDPKVLKQKPNALNESELLTLLSMPKEEAEIAAKYIFYYDGFYSAFNEMVKYISLNRPEYLEEIENSKNKEKTVYNIYTNIYNKEIINQREDNLSQIIKRVDINFYNQIITVQKKYQNKTLTKNERKEFKDFYSEYIKRKAVEEYSRKEEQKNIDLEKCIGEIIDGIVESKLDIYDIYEAFQKRDGTLTMLLSKIKAQIKIDNVDIDILDALKGKTIKNIIKELKDKKIQLLDEELMTAAVKMLAYLRPNDVMQIIRNLPKEKWEAENFLELFKFLSLNNVEVENGKIKYNDEFIKLFMGNNIKEPGSLFNKIKNKETNLTNHIDHIYEYWDELEKRYKSQQLQTKTAFLENAFSQNRVFLNPDEYELENGIIETYLDNKTFQKLNEKTMIKEIRKVYRGMKHKYIKTIPYIKGETDEAVYEILKASDPKLLELGNITGCCYKIGGDSDDFVRYTALNENSRVITIKTKDGKLLAMIPIVRNGNMVICNSIENVVRVGDREYNALREISEKIIQISKEVEREDQRIKAVLISDHKLEDKKTFEKPKKKINVGPIDKSIYTNIGSEYETYIIKKDYQVEEELKEFTPQIQYLDPRDEVIDLENEQIDENVRKKINDIYYEKTGEIIEDKIFDKIKYLSFNKDWFTFITIDNDIYYEITSEDPRAYKEYLISKEAYEEYYHSNKISNISK